MEGGQLFLSAEKAEKSSTGSGGDARRVLGFNTTNILGGGCGLHGDVGC